MRVTPTERGPVAGAYVAESPRSRRIEVEEDRANARLIAAAPDLLEVAQAFLRWYVEDEVPALDVYPLAVRAIAKAAGNGNIAPSRSET